MEAIVRIRSVKPQFFRDGQSTGVWPIDEKLIYAGLWSIADDKGRLAWDLRQIQADLFPFAEGMLLTRGGPSISLAAVLDRLVGSGRVVLYEVDGCAYAWLPNLERHQHPRHPVPSVLPAPPKMTGRERRERPRVMWDITAGPAGPERRGEEGRTEEDLRVTAPDQRNGSLRQPASPRARAPARDDGGGAGLAGCGRGPDLVEQLRLAVAEYSGIEAEDFPIALARDEAHHRATAERLRVAIAKVGYPRALACCRGVVDAKAREGVEVRSLALLAGFVEQLPRHTATSASPVPSGPPAAPPPCDATGAQVKELLRSKLKPDLFARWFAPLGVEVLEQEILLVAPNLLTQQWVADHYATLVAEWSLDLVGRELPVRVTAAGAAARSVQ